MPSEENCALNSKFWVTKFWLNPKRSLGTQQNVTTFSQYLLFPTMAGPGLITFSQQILVSKLLLVLNYDHHLKLCIKKKQKTSPRRLWVEQWILAHLIWLNQKKKKKKEEYNKMIQHFHKKTRFIPS